MFIQINALEKDILREMFNIGVSKAADALSVLIRNQNGITLTVPDIKVIGPKELTVELAQFNNAVLAIRSKVEGDLNGITILLFYDKQVEWIIQHCLPEGELSHTELARLRMSVLLEISNILTGAILTQFSNILGVKVHGLPPEGMITSKEMPLETLICDLPPCQPIVLSVKTDFLERDMVIELPLLMVLEIASLSLILNHIRRKGLYEHVLLKKPDQPADGQPGKMPHQSGASEAAADL